ncbi:hypothetical protein BGX27_000141 [Mortierella sp. AM989]|nr:hypothetical protein BGX27_000141 [Mortierella sp. AM989]
MTFTLSPSIAVTISVELSVNDSPTTQNYGQKTATTSDGCSWTVSLNRSNDQFHVGVTWGGNQSYYDGYQGYGHFLPYFCKYSYLHIVPRNEHGVSDEVTVNAQNLSSQTKVQASIDSRKVRYKDKYSFDIVLSSQAKLPKALVEDTVEPLDAITKNHEIMLILLRDIHSVDVCFVFESDKTCSNVGLWAHRSILSRYKGFESAIQTACKDMTSASEGMANLTVSDGKSSEPSTAEKGSDAFGALLVPVGKFTLATLCVLLRYIYTGVINLSAETNKHAISMTESTLVLQGITSRRKESVRWHPLGSESSWKFKDVTWEELLLASDFYEVTDLRCTCEKKVISAMSNSTVVETLFTIGCQFDKIKESALEYIVRNMATLFQKGKDPFAPYKDHPKCHEMFVELIHRKATAK